MATIDRLEIQIQTSASRANRDLDALTRRLSSLNSSLAGINTSRILGISAGLERAIFPLKNLTKGLKSYNRNTLQASKSSAGLASSIGMLYAKCFLAIRAFKALGKAIKSSMDFQETVNYFEVAFDKIGQDSAKEFEKYGYNSAEKYASSFSDRMKQLNEKMTGYSVDEGGNLQMLDNKNLGLDPEQLMNYEATYAQMSDSIGLIGETSLNTSKALTMLAVDWSSLKNIDISTSAEKFASALSGQSRAIRSLGLDVTITALQELGKQYGINAYQAEQTTKTQLRVLAMLQQSKVAYGDLANTIESPSNQLRILKQQFSNLARTIGNLFLPIITKVLPYINGFVIALQRLFSWFGKLLGIKLDNINSSIGQGGSSMGDLVDNTEDLEDAITGADKAAKKLNSTILGIDELNVVQKEEQNSSGGSAGGGGTSGGGSGALDDAISDALKEYEKAWDEALKKMENKSIEIADKITNAFKKGWKQQDFTFLGKMLGEKLNSSLSSIDWEEIKKTTSKISNSIATFLNGFIESTDWKIVGKTIAEGINTAVLGIDTFITKFNWEKLGTAISTTITTTLNKIDWKKVYTAAQNFGSGFANFLNGLINVELFKELGKTIAKTLNSIINSALSFAKTFDWKTFGNSLATGINNFFSKFNFGKLAETFNTWAKGILTTIGTSLDTVEWDEIGRKIGEFLSGINFIEVTFDLIAIGKKLFDGIVEAIAGLTETAPLETAIIGLFLGLKLTGFGSKIGTLFSTALSSQGITMGKAIIGLGLGLATFKLSESPDKIQSLVAAPITAFLSSLTLTGDIKLSLVISAVTFLFDAALNLRKEFGSALDKNEDKEWLAEASGKDILVKDLKDAMIVWGVLVTGIEEKRSDFVANAWENIKKTWESVSGWFEENVTTPVTGFFKDVYTSVSGFFSDLWADIVKIWETVSGWFEEKVTKPVTGFFEEVYTSVSGFFTDLWNGIKEVWTKVSGWFQEKVINPVVSFFEGLHKRVKEIFEGLWIVIQSVWKTVSEWFEKNVTTPVTDFFKGIYTSVSGFFSDLWADIVKIWETVSGWFEEKVTTPVTDFFEGIYTSVSGFFSDLWADIVKIWETVSGWFEEKVTTPVTDFFEGIYTSVSGFFSDLWDDIVKVWKTVSKWFEDNVTTPISKIFSNIAEGISGAFEGAWKGIKSGVIGAMNAVIGAIEKAINWVIGGINNLISGFNKVVEWAADVIGQEWGGVTLLKEVKFNRISNYEFGGFPTPGELFIANEPGNPELIGNVGGKTGVASPNDIMGGIKQAAYEGMTMALSENNQESGLLRELIQAVREGKVIKIDGRELVAAADNRKYRNGYVFST